MTGSSIHLNDEEIQYLSLLLGIIDSQNWQALGHAILNNPTVFQSFARTVSRSSELNGMTILHACVRFNPPPQTIQILLELVPESPIFVDCLGRTPLHVAAGTGASLPTIQLLVEACPRACGVQDVDGKTPLHLACDSACELFEGDERNPPRGPPSCEVVQMLAKASPMSVPLEDLEGMSALEHAIFSDAPIQVIKLLQHVTRRQCERHQEKHYFDVTPAPQTSAATVIPARRGETSKRRGALLGRSNIVAP